MLLQGMAVLGPLGGPSSPLPREAPEVTFLHRGTFTARVSRVKVTEMAFDLGNMNFSGNMSRGFFPSVFLIMSAMFT